MYSKVIICIIYFYSFNLKFLFFEIHFIDLQHAYTKLCQFKIGK